MKEDGGDAGSERRDDAAVWEGAVRADSEEVRTLRAEDGRAEIRVRRRDGAPAEPVWFRAERSPEGLSAADDLMDRAARRGADAPGTLRRSDAPHPDTVDLLSDERTSVEFWGARRARGRYGRDDCAVTEALDVARQMEQDSDRRPEVAAFEAPEHWVGDVNALGTDAPGRDYNCVFCALATEQRWRGAPVRAGEWPHEEGLSLPTAERLVGPLRSGTPGEIERSVRDAGPGASGVVAMERMTGDGHMVNVVNDGGRVRWVDGQQGTVEAGPPGYAMRFWWNGRDAEGRPL